MNVRDALGRVMVGASAVLAGVILAVVLVVGLREHWLPAVLPEE